MASSRRELLLNEETRPPGLGGRLNTVYVRSSRRRACQRVGSAGPSSPPATSWMEEIPQSQRPATVFVGGGRRLPARRNAPSTRPLCGQHAGGAGRCVGSGADGVGDGPPPIHRGSNIRYDVSACWGGRLARTC